MPSIPPSGLFWAASKITRPDIITPEEFNNWYNERHIPDVFAFKQMRTAVRYQNIDPSAERQFLALYPLKDIAFLKSDEFQKISVTDDVFKTETKSVFDVADFDVRIYDGVGGFESESGRGGAANLIISAALTPAPGTDADFHAWYDDEHYRTLSECKGFVRTRRYKLDTALTGKDVPVYLALHEFDGDALPLEDLARSGATEWAKKIMGGLVGQEVMVFKLLGAWGEERARI